jgi:HD superfamily phosphohydrolase
MFEEFLKAVYKKKNERFTWRHEHASCMMLRQLYEENIHQIKDFITEDDLNFVMQLITNDKKRYPIRHERPQFLYDIVANARNGVDVDKFDYLARDSFHVNIGPGSYSHERLIKNSRAIDGKICFYEKEVTTVYDMFHARYKLHKLCYQHRVSKAIEYMIRDILLAADDYLHISDSIRDPEKYLYMTDGILKEIEASKAPELKAARDLCHRLRCRDLYRCAHEILIPYKFHDMLTSKPDAVQPSHIAQYADSSILSSEDVLIQSLKLNYAKGEKNPVDSVYFFKKHAPNKAININRERVSLMMPEHMQEIFVRIFVTHPTQERMLEARNALMKWGMVNHLPATNVNASPPPTFTTLSPVSASISMGSIDGCTDDEIDQDMNINSNGTALKDEMNGSSNKNDHVNEGDDTQEIASTFDDVKPSKRVAINLMTVHPVRSLSSPEKSISHQRLQSPTNADAAATSYDDSSNAMRSQSTGIAGWTLDTLPHELRRSASPNILASPITSPEPKIAYKRKHDAIASNTDTLGGTPVQQTYMHQHHRPPAHHNLAIATPPSAALLSSNRNLTFQSPQPKLPTSKC